MGVYVQVCESFKFFAQTRTVVGPVARLSSLVLEYLVGHNAMKRFATPLPVVWEHLPDGAAFREEKKKRISKVEAKVAAIGFHPRAKPPRVHPIEAFRPLRRIFKRTGNPKKKKKKGTKRKHDDDDDDDDDGDTQMKKRRTKKPVKDENVS